MKNTNDEMSLDLFSASQSLEKKIYKISEINTIVQNLLETAFSDIWLEGEISNSKLHTSGHFYFSLKDESAQINAVMFKYQYQYLKFRPLNGLKVIVKGKLTCFPKSGIYQINCAYMEPQGKGALQLAFEQLKEKLFKLGWFDEKHKKKIPVLPQKIGIVTSPTGAAIRDILSIISRRYFNIDILIYPVSVQGENAKNEIANAINYLNNHHSDLDVLLVGRGGGSIEDLWAFNEEIVAKAIYESNIPVISCVGHEIDFVISDFVADLRAATPSAAAELVVKNKQELIQKISHYYSIIKSRIQNIYQLKSSALGNISKNTILMDPYTLILNREQNIDYILEKMNSNFKSIMEKKKYDIGILKEKIINFSPTKILKRGYSIVSDINNKILKSVSDMNVNDDICVEFIDGKINCKVLSKMCNGDKNTKH
jgi:exodeoxyribonuclease VII large subunit